MIVICDKVIFNTIFKWSTSVKAVPCVRAFEVHERPKVN